MPATTGWLPTRHRRLAPVAELPGGHRARRGLRHRVPGGGPARTGDRCEGATSAPMPSTTPHPARWATCGWPTCSPACLGRRDLRSGHHPGDLEHLPPDRVPIALEELARVCGGYLYATIPSFGPTDRGPTGTSRARCVPSGSSTTGPSAPATTDRCPSRPGLDATATWSRDTCASPRSSVDGAVREAGFTRCVDVEERLYADIEPADSPATGTSTCSGWPAPTRAWSSPGSRAGRWRARLVHPLSRHRFGR